jgi:hypothetical protein
MDAGSTYTGKVHIKTLTTLCLKFGRHQFDIGVDRIHFLQRICPVPVEIRRFGVDSLVFDQLIERNIKS